MPYLVLIIGLICTIFALYRFMISATPTQVKALVQYAIIGVYILVMLYFALTARIIIAIGLLFLSIPFIFKYYRKKTKTEHNQKADEE